MQFPRVSLNHRFMNFQWKSCSSSVFSTRARGFARVIEGVPVNVREHYHRLVNTRSYGYLASMRYKGFVVRRDGKGKMGFCRVKLGGKGLSVVAGSCEKIVARRHQIWLADAATSTGFAKKTSQISNFPS